MQLDDRIFGLLLNYEYIVLAMSNFAAIKLLLIGNNFSRMKHVTRFLGGNDHQVNNNVQER